MKMGRVIFFQGGQENQPAKQLVLLDLFSKDPSPWEFRLRLNITTSPASNFGYIFRSAAGVWKSNQHPKLTLADAGVKNTGLGLDLSYGKV
jgi:hypothetical protein